MRSNLRERLFEIAANCRACRDDIGGDKFYICDGGKPQQRGKTCKFCGARAAGDFCKQAWN